MGLIEFFLTLSTGSASVPSEEVLITTDSTQHTIDTTTLYTIDTTNTTA